MDKEADKGQCGSGQKSSYHSSSSIDMTVYFEVYLFLTRILLFVFDQGEKSNYQ